MLVYGQTYTTAVCLVYFYIYRLRASAPPWHLVWSSTLPLPSPGCREVLSDLASCYTAVTVPPPLWVGFLGIGRLNYVLLSLTALLVLWLTCLNVSLSCTFLAYPNRGVFRTNLSILPRLSRCLQPAPCRQVSTSSIGMGDIGDLWGSFPLLCLGGC